MKCVIWHPNYGWFCTDDWGHLFFSEHHPAITVWFDSVESARLFFAASREKQFLEMYYPIEQRGTRLFPSPS